MREPFVQNSGYFDIIDTFSSEASAHTLLQQGKIQFAITLPSDFSKNLTRGKKTQVLFEADATDPTTIGNAIDFILFFTLFVIIWIYVSL